MNVEKILDELKAEVMVIEDAILRLEKLARRRGPGPGGPTSWMPPRGPAQPPPSSTPAAAALSLPRRKLVWAVSSRKPL